MSFLFSLVDELRGEKGGGASLYVDLQSGSYHNSGSSGEMEFVTLVSVRFLCVCDAIF